MVPVSPHGTLGGGGNTRQRRCLSRGGERNAQGKVSEPRRQREHKAYRSREGGGNTRQRRCLRCGGGGSAQGKGSWMRRRWKRKATAVSHPGVLEVDRRDPAAVAVQPAVAVDVPEEPQGKGGVSGGNTRETPRNGSGARKAFRQRLSRGGGGNARHSGSVALGLDLLELLALGCPAPRLRLGRRTLPELASLDLDGEPVDHGGGGTHKAKAVS